MCLINGSNTQNFQHIFFNFFYFQHIFYGFQIYSVTCRQKKVEEYKDNAGTRAKSNFNVLSGTSSPNLAGTIFNLCS